MVICYNLLGTLKDKGNGHLKQFSAILHKKDNFCLLVFESFQTWQLFLKEKKLPLN